MLLEIEQLKVCYGKVTALDIREPIRIEKGEGRVFIGCY